MLKQTVTYEDFDGNTQTEDLYFNLSKSEMIDLEASEDNKMSDRLEKAKETNSAEAAYKELKGIILMAYGKKSPDGRKFIKSDELREDFEQSAVYDEFIWQLFRDVDKLTSFINGIIPQKALKEAMDAQGGNKIQLDSVDGYVKPRLKENDEPKKGTFGQPLDEEPKPKAPPGVSPEAFSQWLKENPDALN